MSSIAIIGGGLIGSAAAVWLQSEGHQVTLFEADPAARHASSGNAGLFAVPDTDPLASPSTLLAAPKWLFDPLGPLTLRWRDLAELAPWLLRFALSARPAAVRKTSQAMSFLMRTALADHQRLGELAGLSGHYAHTGAIYVFDREDRLDREFAHLRESHAALGHKLFHLTPAEVRQRVPGLTGKIAGGILMPDYHTVTDPRLVLEGLRAQVERAGRVIAERVQSVERLPEGIVLVTDSGARHRFDKAVISAGIWSRELVRPLGLKVCLETERGYNTTWARSPVDLPLPVCFSEHGFFATPLNGQLRVGGAVELARPEAPANMARAGAMRQVMRRYFPDLPDQGGTEWMGRRPSTPDSIPVISTHPADPRLIMAFGHGHLGLTLSAVTARLVTELAKDEGASAELAPFSISRFQ